MMVTVCIKRGYNNNIKDERKAKDLFLVVVDSFSGARVSAMLQLVTKETTRCCVFCNGDAI